MNEKIQAILLKIVIDLKKLRWNTSPDWEITLKSEGHVPLIKQIVVTESLGELKFKDNIETHVDLKIASDDKITYFPDYTIYANIFVDGIPSRDIAYNMDADVAFTEQDTRNESKISMAANRINRIVEDYIEHEYSDYIDQNEQLIKNNSEENRNHRR